MTSMFKSHKVIDSVLTLKENKNVNESDHGLLSRANNSENNYSENPHQLRILKFSDDYLNELEIYFSNHKLCKLCYETELDKENTFNFDDAHKFCLKCVKNYVLNEVRAGKDNIKCPKIKCKAFRTEITFFRNFLGEEELICLAKIKKRNEFSNSIKWKEYIECVYPDCDQIVKLIKSDGKIIECPRGHKFCTVCKEDCRISKKCIIV